MASILLISTMHIRFIKVISLPIGTRKKTCDVCRIIEKNTSERKQRMDGAANDCFFFQKTNTGNRINEDFIACVDEQ